MARRRASSATSRRSRRSARATARARFASRATRPSARGSGRAARKRSARWAASSSHLVVQDAVVPRTRLPEVLAEIHRIGEANRVQVCNVFHAGDGNLHPNIAYDASDADETRARPCRDARDHDARASKAGGTITGEHGVGLDKLPYMDMIFSADSLATMCALREVFDPERRANPGQGRADARCREWHMAPAGAGGREMTAVAVGARSRSVARSRARCGRTAARRCASSGAGRGSTPVARCARPKRCRRASSSGIVEYVPGDLTLTARAGTTLGEIRDATARARSVARARSARLRRRHDRRDGRHGVGRPLATSFGTPRDLVLGVEFVTGAGAVARGGGRVVKNVAGFDLTRLITGSWGTLGVITEVDGAAARAPRGRRIDRRGDRRRRPASSRVRAVAASTAVRAVRLRDRERRRSRARSARADTTVLLRLGGNSESVARAARRARRARRRARSRRRRLAATARRASRSGAIVFRLSSAAARRSSVSGRAAISRGDVPGRAGARHGRARRRALHRAAERRDRHRVLAARSSTRLGVDDALANGCPPNCGRACAPPPTADRCRAASSERSIRTAC